MNKDIADLFYEIADLLELQGVEWKPNAYRNAARSIESLNESVEVIYKNSGIKGLFAIPGIGRGLADKLIEYIKTGKIKEFDNLIKKFPKGIETILDVPGLGPKKVIRLIKELKIKNLKDLEHAAKSGQIGKLSGFGKRSEEDILKGLALVKQGSRRFLIGQVLPIAHDLVSKLSGLKGVKRVEVAGSLRRMKATIGDIDILVISNNHGVVMDSFTSNVKRVLAKGPTKSSVVLREGIQADVRVIAPDSFGSALQYFTGSVEHNINLRQIAIKKGLKLSEYGLFRKDKQIAGKSEKEIYNKLGLSWVAPELRENRGEIIAAKKHKLPVLVEESDIKGDLHTHSDWSDGLSTIEEMARAAEKLGYKYIALTDHSKSLHVANGMSEKRILQYIKEIDRVQKKVDIRILKGSEVDILPDGSLDYSDKILEQLDVVIGAIHSHFKSSPSDMSVRILKAFENPHMNILAHPTGRIIFRREPYKFDFDAICKSAKEKGIALEINSNPLRLDLNDIMIKQAVDSGCKLAINTDSHHVDNLEFIKLGIGQARRGWAEAKDIINTLPLKRLQKFLRK